VISATAATTTVAAIPARALRTPFGGKTVAVTRRPSTAELAG
jgi:hypothetical protein